MNLAAVPTVLILVRHQVAQHGRARAPILADAPACLFQAPATSLSDRGAPVALGRDYNQRRLRGLQT